MIPQAFIQQWRTHAPWTTDSQVEQDLVLSRAMVEIFNHPHLASTLALRGGTSFNKLYMPEGSRYSEDIDLVQTRAEAIGPTLDALRSQLDPWLGQPRRSFGEGRVTLRYRFAAEAPPSPMMGLKVEINTREHFSVFGHVKNKFTMDSPWFEGRAKVVAYSLDELLGTKLRALYQRKKGRDLFDLWRGMALVGVKPARIVEAFSAYMKHEGHRVTSKQFALNLDAKLKDKTFLNDIRPLLAEGIDYAPQEAAEVVRKNLMVRLR